MFWLLFRRKSKEVFFSPINGVISIGQSFGHKALFVGSVPQSGGEFTYMWSKVIGSLKKFNPKTCLVLGVGGGTVITILQKKYPALKITGVEIDPFILKAAKQYFDFPTSKKIRIVVDNALTWVKKDTKHYNLIVVDLYIEDRNPYQSRKSSFLKSIKNLLKNKGLVLYNCHYQKDELGDFQSFKNVLESIFKHVEEVFTFAKNKIIVLR